MRSFRDGTENKMTRKIISLFLCMLIALTGLCACNRDSGDDVTTTEGVTTEPKAEKTDILFADINDYVIVRPEEASATLINSVVDFDEKLELVNDGKRLRIKDDFTKEGVESLQPAELEIIVGSTKRAETAEFKKDMRYYDYGVTVIGKKIVVFGHTDETTAKALELLLGIILDNSKRDDGVFFSSEQAEVISGSYAVDKATFGGNDIKNYTVVYPKKAQKGEDGMAPLLADFLSDLTGYAIEHKNDKEYAYSADNYEILIGDTNRTSGAPTDLAGEESYISVSGKTVVITGGGYVGIYNAVNEFRKMLEEKEGKEIDLTLNAPLRETIQTEIIKVMSFNVWVSQKSAERDARVIQMINNYMPDVLGVQEASPAWMSTLKNNLKAYACVGLGRDGGSKGEHSAVFYLKDKFTLIDQGTKWLSDTPNVVSKYDESSLNRIYSYAVLKRNSDGKIFVHVNTHFDHTSDTARAKQATSLIKGVAELAAKYPVIMTGDFNTTKGTNAYGTIINGGFVNSSEIAGVKQGDGTFHGNSGKNSIIDFCFVSEGKFSVSKYRVCSEKINGDYASDHHPVYVEIIF